MRQSTVALMVIAAAVLVRETRGQSSSVLAYRGGPAVGGGTYDTILASTIDDSGKVMFSCRLAGSITERLIRGAPSLLSVLQETGDSTPPALLGGGSDQYSGFADADSPIAQTFEFATDYHVRFNAFVANMPGLDYIIGVEPSPMYRVGQASTGLEPGHTPTLNNGFSMWGGINGLVRIGVGSNSTPQLILDYDSVYVGRTVHSIEMHTVCASDPVTPPSWSVPHSGTGFSLTVCEEDGNGIDHHAVLLYGPSALNFNGWLLAAEDGSALPGRSGSVVEWLDMRPVTAGGSRDADLESTTFSVGFQDNSYSVVRARGNGFGSVNITTLIHEGGQAPGFSSGTVVASLTAIGDRQRSGRIVSNGFLTIFPGFVNNGGGCDIPILWGSYEDDDSVFPLVIGEQQAPGLPDGYVFGRLHGDPDCYALPGSEADTLRGHFLCGRDVTIGGSTAFHYAFVGLAVHRANELDPEIKGIWAANPLGELRLVACQGQQINVGGESHTITNLGLYAGTPNYAYGPAGAGGQDGLGSSINSIGQIVYWVWLDNNIGIAAIMYDGVSAACTADLSGCPGDFDHSGGTPDDADIAAFFAAWNNGDPHADMDCSGGTPDDHDSIVFFEHWNNGC